MATKNGNSYEHTNFVLNLLHMRWLADPNTAEFKLIPNLNAMKSVIKHQNNWKKKTILNEYNLFFTKINCSALPFCTENLEI